VCPSYLSLQEESELTHITLHVRHAANVNYVTRKWGCRSDLLADWLDTIDDCRFKTPFNRSVPHWFWHTSKQQRDYDSGVAIKRGPYGTRSLVDSLTYGVVFELPGHFGEWGGYFQDTPMCRLSGWLGRRDHADEAGRTLCF
jgi:hypothetical protein